MQKITKSVLQEGSRGMTMLIPTSAIRDWRDLQDKVADLFREMGYK